MSLERDVLVYRAYLALRKWRVVLEEVRWYSVKVKMWGKSFRIPDIVNLI